MPDGEGMDRRRFLFRMARAGVGAMVLPGIPGWARAGEIEETSRSWRAMGTLIEVRVPDLPRAEAVEAIRRVRRRVEELEAAMTLYRPESPLVAINARPEGRWMEAPVELVDAVAGAALASAATGGAYDPTVAPAMRAWGLYDLEGREADPRVLAVWRSRPGPSAIEVGTADRRLRRLDARMELDLGGIGKGIAVDESLALLRRAGSRAALANLGGEIGVLGAPQDRPRGWPVGIAHPRRPGEICAEFELRSGHVATSGDSERWVETPSGRKHHILDPRTGVPASGAVSLTVWAPTGREADVASTALFVEISRGRSLPETVPCHVVRERDGRLFSEGTLRGSAGRETETTLGDPAGHPARNQSASTACGWGRPKGSSGPRASGNPSG